MTSRAKAWPMTANWRRCSGGHSALAPTSRKAIGAGMHGMMVQIAGRWTPLMRRTYRRLPATTAPVLPADTKASASPVVHELEADDDARAGLVAGRLGRLVVVADDVGGVDDGDVVHARRQERAHARLVADEDDVELRAGGVQRAADDLVRRVVAAGGVDHDAHDALVGRPRSRRR